MGLLEILLAAAIILKWIGMAFVTTSYWTILGAYLGGYLIILGITAIIFLIGLAKSR